jgi:hypothetical protein
MSVDLKLARQAADDLDSHALAQWVRALADEVERLQKEVSGVRERMGGQIEDLTKGRHWQLEREREEVWKPLLEAGEEFRKLAEERDGKPFADPELYAWDRWGGAIAKAREAIK